MYWDENESGAALKELFKILMSRKAFPYDNKSFCAVASFILEPSDVELVIRGGSGSPHLELMKNILEARK